MKTIPDADHMKIESDRLENVDAWRFDCEVDGADKQMGEIGSHQDVHRRHTVRSGCSLAGIIQHEYSYRPDSSKGNYRPKH